MGDFRVLAADAPSHCALTLAADLQGVQQPGGPTDRHREDQCRLQLVCLHQCCGTGEQQARVEDLKRAANVKL